MSSLLQKSRDNSTWTTNIWSLNSPFDSTQPQTAEEMALATKRGPDFPSNLEEQEGVARDQSYLENTYDLFKDKNIWGIGTETPSTSIWAQLNSTDVPPTDPK